MELKKYHSHEILPVIRHNMRALPDGSYGNESIVPELKMENEELISRGETPEAVNRYRKNLEKEIFKFGRKNLVHAVNVVIQCPDDCPPEEEERFFKTCYQFWVDRLPMGERCILQAVIHRDEIVKDVNGRRISKNHMHLSFVPAVPDKKHEGYEFKLNAYDLTNKNVLKKLHPQLQERLNAEGIHATVMKKRKGDGHTLKLSVADLKKITELTGCTVERPITIEAFAGMINEAWDNIETIEKMTGELETKNAEVEKLLKSIADEKSRNQKEVEALKEKVEEMRNTLDESRKENERLKGEVENRTQTPTKRSFSWNNHTANTHQNLEKEREVTL